MTLDQAISTIDNALQRELSPVALTQLRSLAGRIRLAGRTDVGGRPSKDYTCPICGEVITGSRALRDHKRGHR